MWVDFDVGGGPQGMDFITGGCIIMDHGLVRSDSLKLKRLNDGFFLLQTRIFCLHKMLIYGVAWILVELLVDYYGVFISCLNSHSDGTHSLQEDPLVG